MAVDPDPHESALIFPGRILAPDPGGKIKNNNLKNDRKLVINVILFLKSVK